MELGVPRTDERRIGDGRGAETAIDAPEIPRLEKLQHLRFLVVIAQHGIHAPGISRRSPPPDAARFGGLAATN